MRVSEEAGYHETWDRFSQLHYGPAHFLLSASLLAHSSGAQRPVAC